MRHIAVVSMICAACTVPGAEVVPSPAPVASAKATVVSSRLEGGTWSLELPQGWLSKQTEPAVSVFRPGGVGALQISAYFRDASVTDDDLLKLAEESPRPAAVPEPVELGEFTGFQITFAVDDTFWSRWYLRHGRQALFITYNCPVAQRGSEYDEVKRLLQTLEAIDA